MNPLAEFMTKAKDLTRNPLGIIALFISLIYGVACLVLSINLDHLKGDCERLPLIWFIIVFPILILIAFVYLVVFHHAKLYAPGDFKDEANFIKTIPAREQQLRLQNEVQAIREDSDEPDPGVHPLPDEESEPVNPSNVSNESLENKYLIAEDFALRALEETHKFSVQRQKRMVGKTNGSFEFDGIAFANNLVYGIDVKYTVHSYLSKKLTERITSELTRYEKEIRSMEFLGDIKIILIVVTEKNAVTRLRQDILNLTTAVRYPLEIVVYSFTNLKHRFGTSGTISITDHQ